MTRTMEASQVATQYEGIAPDVSHLVTEDDTPVDNLFSAKQQRLLVEPLYSAGAVPPPFLADANVGVFASPKIPPIVPDMFLSLDVALAEDWWAKEHRSYFVWEFGKPPDVVVEIVSNEEGGEADRKIQAYARMGASYYVIFDPQHLVQSQTLRVYELHVGEYFPRPDTKLPRVNLELMLWHGFFEDKEAEWLRWCDAAGNLIPTGAERANRESQRADRESQRADHESQRAERLAARLRELGVNPDEV